MAPEEDHLFNLIDRSDLWHLEPESIQYYLKSMYSNDQIKDGLLYRLVGSDWLPYVKLSSRAQDVMNDHTQVGHGAVKKILKWLKSLCFRTGLQAI